MKSHFLGKKLSGMLLTVEWGNPYTDPPNGASRILWACSVPWPCNFDERELFPSSPPGYTNYYKCFDLTPPRKWSPESKARVRFQRMKSRIWKKDPLFADQLISQALREKPEYFDPAAIAEADRRHESKMAEVEKRVIEEFLGNCITARVEKETN